MSVYAILAVTGILGLTIRSLALATHRLHASVALHNNLVNSIMVPLTGLIVDALINYIATPLIHSFSLIHTPIITHLHTHPSHHHSSTPLVTPCT